ncbi:MAG: UDP-N-acetylmuramoyl-L-alanyl-D-glutamate--2,6-diaminopimelate ligase [Acidimicrobiales bacterium]
MKPETPTQLGDVVARLQERVGEIIVKGATDVWITGIEHDHRALTANLPAASSVNKHRGELFCCLAGEHHDGHERAADARARGAAAFICERDLGDAAGTAAQLIVQPGRAREAMAHAACLVWNDPARRVKTLGVTGTNGKTTTTYLLSSVLAAAGFETTLVGTLSGTRTTPEATELQRRFHAAAVRADEAGRPGAVAIEATSHALAQHRVDGYVHDVAVFTNLSRDHLDYHGTMDAYFAAKAILFTEDHARTGVVNGDDEYGRRLLELARIPVVAFKSEEAENIELTPEGSRFNLRGHDIALPLLGHFNVENALAAASAARALGISDEEIARGLTSASAVPGRFEAVGNALGVRVVVDYAHTPAALEQACITLKGILDPRSHLIVVFGAGGDRDHEKRPQMGRAASFTSDIVVVTTDNPRHEDPIAIIEHVVAGCVGAASVHVEPDRRRAIALGLSLARPGDLLLLAGKGHETTQQIGDELQEFDDRVVASEEASRLAGAA